MGMSAILVMWPGPFEHTFVRPYQGGSIWNSASTGLAVIEEKKFANIKLNLSVLDQGQWMTLNFRTHKASCTRLVDSIFIDYNSF